jgi:hypothetical protein
MFSSEPDGYLCPSCLVIAGGEQEREIVTQRDVVRRRELATSH